MGIFGMFEGAPTFRFCPPFFGSGYAGLGEKMSGPQYPVIVFEAEGDSAAVWVYESPRAIECFLDEFADSIDMFLLWDSRGRRVRLLGGQPRSSAPALALEVDDNPEIKEFLEFTNRLARHRRPDAISDLEDAIEFLRGETRT